VSAAVPALIVLSGEVVVDLQLCAGLLAVLCQPVRPVLDDGLLDALRALPRLQNLSELEKDLFLPVFADPGCLSRIRIRNTDSCSCADEIHLHIDTDL
jgi:hypothetical protein